MSTQDGIVIAERLERWRRNLIDTSRKNRLINFIESGGVLRLSRPDASTIFHRLIIRNEELEVGLDECGTDSSGMLLSDRDRAVIDRTLLNLRLKAREAQREQGINILFLSIGMLEWTDSGGHNLRSPLILIPVELRRSGPLQPYHVVSIDEEVTVNPILAHKLRTEYGLDLHHISVDKTPETIDIVMNQIREVVASAGWVITSGNYLGLFSFAKMAMYEELTTYKNLALEHPVVNALAGCPSRLSVANVITSNGSNGNGNLPETYQVLDADSSQQEALDLAKKGVSFVLQGPPGTGKSQTITNIIAEALAADKTVLFVSEKMAALEVVKKRLDDVGLGEYCMELHSRKADRKEVAAELGRCLQLNSITPTASSDVLEDFDILKRRLDNYVDALHKVRPGVGISFYQINSELVSLHAAPDIVIHFSDLHNMGVKDLETIGPLVREIEREISTLSKDHYHPWTDCILDSWKVSILPELEAHLVSCQNYIEDVLGLSSSLAERYDIEAPSSLADTTDLIEHFRLITLGPKPEAYWISNSQEIIDLISELREAYHVLDSSKERLRTRYDKGILSLDLENIYQRMETKYRSPLRWLRSDYRRDMRLLRKHRISLKKVHLEEATKDVAIALSIMKHMEAVEALESICSQHLGKYFFGRATNWDDLINILEWCDSYFQRYGAPNHSLEQLITGQEINITTVEIDELEKAISLAESNIDKVTEYFDLTVTLAGRSHYDVDLAEIELWAKKHLDTLDQAQEWVHINYLKQECRKHNLLDLFSLAKDGLLPARGLWDAVKKRYYSLWHDHIVSTDARLRELSREEYTELSARFRLLDRYQLDIAASQLITLLQGRREVLLSDPTPALGTSLWTLRREVNRKRGLRPLRELFARSGDAILKLKPCLLMSPISVSMHLDPSLIHFDLVIFDEASQIRPEDAIGSIMRGKQIIIVGDTMQLPPTDFFRESLDEDEDIPDLESILDECASCLPHRMLRWHYRSEDESLIAFSNHHFYGGRLFTFPSAGIADGRGVDFVHVPEGLYDRSASRRNIQEAAKIVDMVIQHYQEDPTSSIGVVAFSEAQQMAILERLESQIRERPELARHFIEGLQEEFFVKNLESVQGDERDIILFSIGYGKDSNGRMHQSLGPLNRTGGERRLNVAITRARKSLTIVSSILPQDLKSTSAGVKLLKQFMEYAMAGGVRDALPVEVDKALPPLDIAIMEELERVGLKVHPQWGCSGYRIDLAIESDGKMIMALETDGASYRSWPTTRDRERLRQEMLLKLGWEVYRTWSSDWVRDPEGEIERIVHSVEEAKRKQIASKEIASTKLEIENIAYGSVKPIEIDELVPVSSVANDQQVSEYEAEQENSVMPYTHVDWKDYPNLIEQLYTNPSEGLAKAIETIVTIEGPIHPSVIHERIRELCKLTSPELRVSQNEEANIIKQLIEEERVVERDEFVWLSEMSGSIVRSSTNDRRRELWFVCMEELQAAILYLLNEGVMDERELVRRTTSLYGYKRSSPRAHRRILEAIEELISLGQLTHTGRLIKKVN